MEVRIAVLADFASVTNDQKLNILGVFRQILALQTPVVHPQFKLISQLEFSSIENGEKQVKIELVDEDGQELLSISGKLIVERNRNGRATTVNNVVDFAGLVFPRFGDYEFRIAIDGHPICEIPLTVTQITVPAAES